uniref:Uncharacterized protein n=1 Tax=Oryza meridionalis TaxID=40149 RepID=A0A0E0CR22_9ORYZ
MLESYCNLMLDLHRECPEELREAAAAGLIYASARCGDVPELQEVKGCHGGESGGRDDDRRRPGGALFDRATKRRSPATRFWVMARNTWQEGRGVMGLAGGGGGEGEGEEGRGHGGSPAATGAVAAPSVTTPSLRPRHRCGSAIGSPLATLLEK